MKNLMRIILVGVLACALVGICSCAKQDGAKQDASKQEETQSESEQLIEVIIPLKAPDFTSECTNLPVRVVGNEVDGKQVEEVCYVDPEGKGIKLAPGDYSFAVAASPLAPDGRLFTIPEPGIGITLTSDEVQAGTYEVSEDLAWALIFEEVADITAEQVKEAYEYALKSPGQEALAQELYGAFADIVSD